MPLYAVTVTDPNAPRAGAACTDVTTFATKASVGLGNCDNTSDANKPVSTAQQTALNGKAALPAVSATSATTGTMTVAMGPGVRTITPTGACTFNASGGTAGDICTFAITTQGSSSFTLTWGTNFRKTGTLATGTTSARFFSVSFVCLDGTTWQEISRTAVQT